MTPLLFISVCTFTNGKRFIRVSEDNKEWRDVKPEEVEIVKSIIVEAR